MGKPCEQSEDIERFVQDLLEKLRMALQHLDRAQRLSCQPADRRYYMSWCRKHIDTAIDSATSLRGELQAQRWSSLNREG